uniref:Uncharacterized protein n=1 Tax=Setaria italica TaxID=4555 RepID=K4AP32_SETIT
MFSDLDRVGTRTHVPFQKAKTPCIVHEEHSRAIVINDKAMNKEKK